MTDIDSADLEPEPGDSDRGEDPTISDGPDRLPPTQKVAAHTDLERVHACVMQRAGVPTKPRGEVKASGGFGRQPGENTAS